MSNKYNIFIPKLLTFIFIFLQSLQIQAHTAGEIRNPDVYRQLISKIFSTMRTVERNRLTRETGFVVEQGGIYYSMDKLLFSAVVDKLIDDLTLDEFEECSHCKEEFKNETQSKLKKIMAIGSSSLQAGSRYASNVKNFFSMDLPFMAADYIGEYGYFAAFFKGIFEVVETISLPIHGMCWLGDGVYFLLDFPLRHIIRARGLKDESLSFKDKVEIYKSFMLKFNRLLFSFTKLHRDQFPESYVKRASMIELIEESLHRKGEVIDLFFDSLSERGFFTRPQNWAYASRFLGASNSRELPSSLPSIRAESFEDILLNANQGHSKNEYIKKLRDLAQIEYSQQQFLISLIREYIHSRYLRKEISYTEAISARYRTGQLGTAVSKLRFALHGLALKSYDLHNDDRESIALQIKTLKLELNNDFEVFFNANNKAERRDVARRAVLRVDSLFYKKKTSYFDQIQKMGANCITRLRQSVR